MKSIKCPQCGLVNWITAEWCKRCKFSFKDNNPPFANKNNYSQTVSADSQPENSYGTSSDQSNESEENKTSIYGFKSYRRSAPYNIKDGFLAQNIERCKRNLMIVCVLTIVAVFGAFIFNFKYLSNVVFGPSAIEQEKLLYGNNLQTDFRNYVKVSAEEVYDTGGTYVEISKYRVETVKSKYYFLQIKDKLLLAEVDPHSPIIDGAKNVSLEGEIAEVPLTVSSEIVAPILREQPEIRSSLLPYMLKAKGDYNNPAYIGAGIGFIILLVAGFCLWSVLKKLGDPENSSIMESLKAYGSNVEIVASIDSEIGGHHEKVGSIHLLPTWIIKNNTFSISVQHIEEIVWIYKKVTKHSVNFIPAGKTYEVVLHNTNGTSVNLNGTFLNDQKTNQMMETIYERIPWVVTGFDDQLLSYWNSDKNSFIHSVKERKMSYFESVNNPEYQKAEPA